MKNLKDYLNVNTFVALVFILLLFAVFYTCTKTILSGADKEINNALIDTMKSWKSKKGLNHSEKQTIVTKDVNSLLELKSRDVEIQKLQKLVLQYKSELKRGSGITRFGNTTTIDTFYTKPIIKYVNYYWKDSIKNKWVDWNYSVNQDSITKTNKINFSLALENEYAIINKEKSNGWFKKPTPYTEIINYNPYTKTKSQISYKVSSEVRSKRIGIGPNVSWGFGNSFQPQVFIGIGVQYNIIRF